MRIRFIRCSLFLVIAAVTRMASAGEKVPDIARVFPADTVVYLAFEEIILRALVQGLDRQSLIGQPGHHDDRYRGNLMVDPDKCFEAAAVGKYQVQQDYIDPAP